MGDPVWGSGRCTCGAVRYDLQVVPMFVHCCHCRWCQRESGGAFALNALIETAHVHLQRGRPDLGLIPSESGRGQKVARCPDCRVALWSHYPGAGEGIAFIRVGTLETPDRLPPDVHIYTGSKQPWVILSPGGAPAFAEYYDREHLWPADSLTRRNAVAHVWR